MNIREIGSEFWDVPQAWGNGLFPQRTAWFLSGRWALDFILRDILTELTVPCSAALPSWCCHTMIQPFQSHGFSVKFYPVLPDPEGGLITDLAQVMDCGVMLVMDYFGYEGKPLPLGFRGVVIRDTTHSLFTTPPMDADYVFGSLRKWAGFWTGGYAWKRKGAFHLTPPRKTEDAYVSLRRRAMGEKRAYLEGWTEDKGYLSVFAETEALLDIWTERTGAAERDIAAAECFDVALLRRKRRENAGTLLKGVSHLALFPRLGEKDCPLFVPILVPEGRRDELRQFLIKRDIYCPVHWPVSSLRHLTKEERRVYDGEMSLVCDQRYGEADMGRILLAIEEFFGKGEIQC